MTSAFRAASPASEALRVAARKVSLLLSICLLLALSSCASIGPATVPRDREDYLEALGSSWKEQTLLNIVRLRYADAPTFLDVSSIVSSYSLQGQVSAGGQINSSRTATVPGASATFGASATYLDRPTISYTPIAGDRFTKSLLTPIPPAAVFELIQAGYPADFVLQVTTRALNGVFNRSSVGGRARGADPKFYPILDALRRLQLSGAVGLRLDRRGQDETLRLIRLDSLAGQRSADPSYSRRALFSTRMPALAAGPRFAFIAARTRDIVSAYFASRWWEVTRIRGSRRKESPARPGYRGPTALAAGIADENPLDLRRSYIGDSYAHRALGLWPGAVATSAMLCNPRRLT